MNRDGFLSALPIAAYRLNHTLSDETIRDDFPAFLEERDYSLSYKMPFLLSFLDHVDPSDLEEVSLNHALLARMSDADWERVRAQMRADLGDYHVRT